MLASQTELGLLLGVSVDTVARWSQHGRLPKARVVDGERHARYSLREVAAVRPEMDYRDLCLALLMLRRLERQATERRRVPCIAL